MYLFYGDFFQGNLVGKMSDWVTNYTIKAQ